MRWFVSDLHFFHNLVYRKYRSNFDTIEDMHKDIIKKWNKKVKAKDTVYIIGDVTFGKFEETKELLAKLNGEKVLIRGNHDERFTSAEWVELGFKDVRDTYVIKKENEKWILSHYPYSSSFKFFFYKWLNRKRGEAGYYKLYLPYKGYKLIHGHHHSGPQYRHDQVNVAWDVNGTLLNENDIKELFTKNEVGTLQKIINMIKLILW